MALGNLAQRFLVAVVAVPILLLVLYYHRPEPTWIIIFIASLLAMREFFGMTLPAEDRGAALVMGGLASAAFYWLDFHTLAYAPSSHVLRGFVAAGSTIALVFAVIVPGLYYLFRFRDIPSVAHMTAVIHARLRDCAGLRCSSVYTLDSEDGLLERVGGLGEPEADHTVLAGAVFRTPAGGPPLRDGGRAATGGGARVVLIARDRRRATTRVRALGRSDRRCARHAGR